MKTNYDEKNKSSQNFPKTKNNYIHLLREDNSTPVVSEHLLFYFIKMPLSPAKISP